MKNLLVCDMDVTLGIWSSQCKASVSESVPGGSSAAMTWDKCFDYGNVLTSSLWGAKEQ